MALANCVLCKKVFDKTSSTPICPSCQEKEEEKYDVVYAYLKDNPNRSISEIAKATEVSEKLILKFFREGRFVDTIIGTSSSFLNCEKCGTPIEKGRYCTTCMMDMSKDINKAFGTNHSFKDIANHGKKDGPSQVTIMTDRGMKR